MAKDKRSRSRKSSENKQDPASRSGSAATAVRVPLPSSSPTSESVSGDLSDHEENVETESNAGEAQSPQNLENTQNQDASQVGGDPVLTEDGALTMPQIEPGLGDIVEASASSSAVEDTQSPTNTDQSTSPDSQKPLFNLDTELQGAGSDNSEGDIQSEEGDPGISPFAARTDSAPTAEESQKPRNADSGQAENIQEEIRKRLAAEKEVKALKAKMKAQQQKFDDDAEKAKRKHEHALHKANQAREADKVKMEKKAEQKLQAEVEKFEKNIERLETLHAHEEVSGRTTTGNDVRRDAASPKKTPAITKEVSQAIRKEINSGSQTAPVVRQPLASNIDRRAGSARFLLAECEYLLDKSTPVYTAVRAMADFADGEAEFPCEEDSTLFGKFNEQLDGMIKLMEKYLDRPNECLLASRKDWEVAMDTWKKGSSEEK